MEQNNTVTSLHISNSYKETTIAQEDLNNLMEQAGNHTTTAEIQKTESLGATVTVDTEGIAKLEEIDKNTPKISLSQKDLNDLMVQGGNHTTTAEIQKTESLGATVTVDTLVSPNNSSTKNLKVNQVCQPEEEDKEKKLKGKAEESSSSSDLVFYGTKIANAAATASNKKAGRKKLRLTTLQKYTGKLPSIRSSLPLKPKLLSELPPVLTQPTVPIPNLLQQNKRNVLVQNISWGFNYLILVVFPELVHMHLGTNTEVGLLEFANAETANLACHTLDGLLLNSKTLKARVVQGNWEFNRLNEEYLSARQLERDSKSDDIESSAVIVTDLHQRHTEIDLQRAFEPFQPREIHSFDTFAIVTFYRPDSALESLNLHGTRIGDCHNVSVYRCATLPLFLTATESMVDAYRHLGFDIIKFYGTP